MRTTKYERRCPGRLAEPPFDFEPVMMRELGAAALEQVSGGLYNDGKRIEPCPLP